jgi:hypothetical protein
MSARVRSIYPGTPVLSETLLSATAAFGPAKGAPRLRSMDAETYKDDANRAIGKIQLCEKVVSHHARLKQE